IRAIAVVHQAFEMKALDGPTNVPIPAFDHLDEWDKRAAHCSISFSNVLGERERIGLDPLAGDRVGYPVKSRVAFERRNDVHTRLSECHRDAVPVSTQRGLGISLSQDGSNLVQAGSRA